MRGESLGFVPAEAREKPKSDFAARWEARNFADRAIGERLAELKAVVLKNDERKDGALQQISKLRALREDLKGAEDVSEAAAEQFIRAEIFRINNEAGGEPGDVDGQKMDRLIKHYGAFHENLTEK